MNPRTLAQFRASVDQRGQYENSGDIHPINPNTRLVDNSMLNEFVNEAAQEVFDILVQKWADYYTIVSPNFSLVANQQQYQLDTFGGVTGIAPQFYKLRKVEVLTAGTGVQTDATNRWKRLFPTSLDAQHLYSQWGLVAKGYRYYVAPLQFLNIVPIPQNPDTLRIWYVPYMTKMVADTDTFDGVNGYEELVVQLALLRCKMREELPTDDIEREIARLWSRVKTSADGLDAADPFYLNPSGPGFGEDLDDDAGGWW